MEKSHNLPACNRRHFLKTTTVGGFALAATPFFISSRLAENIHNAKIKMDEKPKTNIDDALKYPRTKNSMPGKYPAKVTEVYHENCITKENQIDKDTAYEMVKTAMQKLTGKKKLKRAWREFVTPGEKIALKVNPVAGKQLSTSVEITQAVVKQLNEAGIKSEDIVIWDRREFQLYETGFTQENFPGVTITGTECKDENDSFVDENGELYSLQRIDKDWYYWADVEMEYNAETLPYMVNEGKYSYFAKICTQKVDKIINLPILKNAGPSVTLALKNLAYGAISNTSRLHKALWHDTCAEVCAFPPLRDKVVLNIVDGIKGCYNGGPGANPQFFTNYKTVLAASDPVAIDRIGYEIVLKKRIEKGLQEEDLPRARAFLNSAQELQLGTADLDKIEHQKIKLA